MYYLIYGQVLLVRDCRLGRGRVKLGEDDVLPKLKLFLSKLSHG